MRILPQSASVSYSLLPAPAPRLMLPAPQLAGLLPAPRPQITVEKRKKAQHYAEPRSHVFRSLAEWEAADAELAEMFEAAMQRLNLAWGVTHA